MELRAFALFCAFLVDCIVGDPHGIPHCIVLIGNFVSATEAKLRKGRTLTMEQELAAGRVLVFVTLLITALFFGGVWLGAKCIDPRLGFVVEVLVYWQVMAAKALYVESKKVKEVLESASLEQAQLALSMIVGRDTTVLDYEGIIKATVETVAENTSDGIIAPLFYCFIGGPIGGLLYKAVNTMDSMVGYKNDKYINFGRAAAKLDDLANWIPARISAWLMILMATPLHLSTSGAYRIWKRDRKNHESPNSAQTESACAGAIGIQLAGDAVYGGVLHKKPFIGDKTREVKVTDILRASKLMYGATVLWLVVLALTSIGLDHLML